MFSQVVSETAGEKEIQQRGIQQGNEDAMTGKRWSKDEILGDRFKNHPNFKTLSRVHEEMEDAYVLTVQFGGINGEITKLPKTKNFERFCGAIEGDTL